MAHEQNLPWELMEEILSRVPPESLVRFRTVSKQWNDLFHDKTFINNHKMTFRFILTTKSKFYSVSITPKVEVRELTLDIPGLESQEVKRLVDCNGILLCGTDKGAVVWNPWLRQTRWINQPSLQFDGICYEYDDRSSYRIIAFYQDQGLDPNHRYWKIFDCSTNSWKKQELESGGSRSSSSSGSNDENLVNLLNKGGVSLNGVVYWVAYFVKTSLFFLLSFDFSTERFFNFGDLPCGENLHGDALVLRVFKGDRFSLLKQSHLFKKIEIWVTKNKIEEKWCGEDLEWMNIMEVSIPTLPGLVQTGSKSNPQPSYFIDDKKLVICSCDENGKAWIYVVGDNILISKTQIDFVVDPWPLHCTCFPSLVSVPRVQREEAEVLV